MFECDFVVLLLLLFFIVVGLGTDAVGGSQPCSDVWKKNERVRVEIFRRFILFGITGAYIWCKQ